MKNLIYKFLAKPFTGISTGVLLHQSVRTSYVVERRFPARLVKPGRRPDYRKRHFIYDTVDHNEPTKTYMDVLLTKYVKNIGQKGDIVNIRAKDGRMLILTKDAVYPSKENVEALGKISDGQEQTFSSKYVKGTLERLSKFILFVTMSKENPWVLEPWHIRTSFRKAHVIVPESAITMPKQPIKGPDMSLEMKDFFVTITINKTETSIVRCRIHHWTTEMSDRIPHVRYPWKYEQEPVFPEDREIQKQLPPIEPPDENELVEISSSSSSKR